MTAKEKYRELYIKHVIEEQGSTTEEMGHLFQKILEEDFGDDPEKMSQFIQSIVDENTVKEPTEIDKLRQENESLQQELAMTQAAFMEVTDYVFSK